MTEREEPIYVGVENPAEVRRALLESSKALIHILQGNEKLKARKAKKKELAIKLSETVREATHLMVQLRSLMPRVKMTSLPKKERIAPEPRAIPQQAHVQRAAPVRKMSEAEKLDQELKDIEEKLSRL